ncbi:MAG: hypothetical protein JJV88_00885 [Sulfurovum sp.]|nr:hypothetical protein [Sulfurovaceae bacterium]
MEERINNIIKEVQESDSIASDNKDAIMIKLKEWREEGEAISDINNHFEQFWIDLEPIFAKLGWI